MLDTHPYRFVAPVNDSAMWRVKTIFDSVGITMNGSNVGDITIYNPAVYRALLRKGTLGMGEAYMNGWWDVVGGPEKGIPAMVDKALRGDIRTKIHNFLILLTYLPQLLNLPRWRPFQIGEQHYDIGNELYGPMLGPTMAYTCGSWKPGVETLDAAQRAKFELTCEKLELEKGMRVLDVGGGWGSFAKYMAERYGVEVVVTTVSKAQFGYMNSRVRDALVTPRLQDWRDTPKEKFDRIVSLGSFEHFGRRNYKDFFRIMRQSLTSDGLFLLHTMGSPCTVRTGDPWIFKYVFPNSMLPSEEQIRNATGNLFFLKDWHQWPQDFYEKTFLAWYRNFSTAWESVEGGNYDERFRRMWEYYLLIMAGSFRAEHILLWQIILSPEDRTYNRRSDFGHRL